MTSKSSISGKHVQANKYNTTLHFCWNQHHQSTTLIYPFSNSKTFSL